MIRFALHFEENGNVDRTGSCGSVIGDLPPAAKTALSCLARPSLGQALEENNTGIEKIHAMQVKAALQLWDGVGTFLYTGSAGIYATEDGSEVTERSATAQLGKDDRTDR